MNPENIPNPLPPGDQPVSTPPMSPPPPDSYSSDVVTPAGVGIRIDDVNQSLWQYIKQRKLREMLLLVPFVVIWEAFVIFLFIQFLRYSSGNNSSSGRGFGYLIVAPFIIFSSWLYKIKKQFEDAFLEEFALANGYSFDKDGMVDETYGTIFRLNGNQRVSDVVTGTYQGNAIRLFIYELTVGRGNQSRKYENTVIELDLHGQLPNLLMVNKKSKNRQLDLASSFGIKNTFSLEGDFNQYFTLYGQPDNQIEALQVFSPDTMALMEDESKHYTVEFSGDRIYIYANGFIGTIQDITQSFALAKKLIDKIAPLASRLQHDSAIIATPVNIIQTRKAHVFASKLGFGVFIVTIIIGLSLTVLGVVIGEQSEHATTSNVGMSQDQPIASDVASAITISNEFVQDLAQGNITGAQQLESPRLQQDANQSHYLANQNWHGFAVNRMIDKESGVDDQGTWVGVVYEDDSGLKSFYMKLILSPYGQSWRVWLFQTSYDTLCAAPSGCPLKVGD